jgi:uncharacterized MAPEG superfamily protein
MALGGKKFDVKNPRTYVASLKEDQSLDSATKDKIIRAEGAQQNGFENVGFFAAAVVAGNVAGLDNFTLNYLTGGYLASRAIYVWLYINNQSETTGMLGMITPLGKAQTNKTQRIRGRPSSSVASA